MVKIVDDLVLCGPIDVVDEHTDSVGRWSTPRTITRGPGLLRSFVINKMQNEDYTFPADSDDEMLALETIPFSRLRRKATDKRLSPLELRAFVSVSSAVDWLGIASSPFCSLFASQIKQKAPTATAADLAKQSNYQAQLNRIGT